jgi:hypothetical protein
LLIAPASLSNERIRERFPVESFVQPVMNPGDALLFRGGVPHRTHVKPSMTQDRTSIELRFFPADAIPQRLDGDRFVHL